ncbi:MAG: DNA primase, partial [Candidatus Omnitrophica bacterium]|nr:DNA primase [Candidatus Omnitrophota bacterium]
MSPLVPDNVLDQILDKCNIVEIISSYIPLKRAGRNYKALCPFHHEKTPSFMVNPDKGIFHCFGCGAGGNAITFIMKYERMEFGEVVKMLAKKAGVILPEYSSKESAGRTSFIDALYEIQLYASSFFQSMLVSGSGKTALQYLTNRGITKETMSAFKLGFAPGTWDSLVTYLNKKGFSRKVIEKSGLAIPREDKASHYDRFRNRIMFPITDHRDRIVAFGARALDDTLPKYMNSPESEVYNKRKVLFGLNYAKKEISTEDTAVIVEGYTDVLIPHQSGMKNVIASCGTALTDDHVRLLKRYTRNVIMIYDADKAGEMATLRGLDTLLVQDMKVGVAKLPPSLDPDSFIRKYGIDAFKKIVRTPVDLFDYKLGMLKNTYGVTDVHSKIKIAEEMLKTITKINNAVLKSEYVKRLSESLGLNEDSLRIEMKKIKTENGSTPITRPIHINDETREMSSAEKIIIGVILEDNSLIGEVKNRITVGEFTSEVSRRIVEAIFDFYDKNKPVGYASLINHVEYEGIENIISEIANTQHVFKDKMKNLSD